MNDDSTMVLGVTRKVGELIFYCQKGCTSDKCRSRRVGLQTPGFKALN